MKIRLTNPTYSYLENGLSNLTCEIQIYDEATDTVIWSKSYSVTFNLGNTSSLESAKEKIKQEALASWNRFQWCAEQVNNLFGTTDFNEAVNTMLSSLETDINNEIGA